MFVPLMYAFAQEILNNVIYLYARFLCLGYEPNCLAMSATKRGRRKSKYFLRESVLKARQRQLSLKNHSWIPPKSPFSLIQETLFHDPWKLLVATIFLNRTNRAKAIPLFMCFLDKWEKAEDVNKKDVEEIAELMRPLGLHKRRALVIYRFSSKDLYSIYCCFGISILQMLQRVEPVEV